MGSVGLQVYLEYITLLISPLPFFFIRIFSLVVFVDTNIHCKSGGLGWAIIIFCLYAIAIGTNVFLSWWLSHWSTEEQQHGGRPSYFYYSIYIGIGGSYVMFHQFVHCSDISFVVFYVIVASARAFAFFDWGTTCALNLHNRLFNTVIRAPMWYFDVYVDISEYPRCSYFVFVGFICLF